MGETDSKGYYRTLGVSASASADEIRAAFRKLAKKFHPDTNPDPDAPRIFQAIHDAYETLRDAHRRSQYDRLFSEPKSGVEESPNPRKHWNLSPGVALLGLLLAVPAVLIAYVQAESWIRAVTTTDSGPPTCRTPPLNGQVLEDNTTWTWNANAMEIQNRSRRDAIIEIRDATSDKTLVSFFVAGNASARFGRIPDGTYRIQYAFGKKLDGDCTKFLNHSAASELPDAQTFATRSEGIEIVHQVASYDLSCARGQRSPQYYRRRRFQCTMKPASAE